MSRWPGFAAATILTAWYLATMAHGLMWFDTGELALVAAQWGLGHPPGQPLYAMLSGLFARLPGVDPLIGMNALSAVSAGLCAIPADALIRRVADVPPRVRLGALLAVGALAPIWDQGTRIELYAPATLLLLWLLAAGAAAIHDESARARRWLGIGLIAGALAGVNPVFAIAGALSVGAFATLRLILGDPWGLLRAGLAAAIGGVAAVAAAYGYVYAVHDRADRFVWGTWTADGARAYFSGADYAHIEHGALSDIPPHALEWAAWLAWQGALPVVALGLLGWIAARSTRTHLPLALFPMAMGAYFTFSYGATFYPEIPDYNGYLAPLMWLCVVGLAVGLARLGPRAGAAVAAALLVVTLTTGDRPAWVRSRAGDDVARQYATAWLESAPPNALAIVASDHLVFPAWYLHDVAGLRPDLVLLNLGFASSDWYWRNLYARYPDLPRIELAAPNVAVRLNRLIDAAGRPVQVEGVEIAGGLGRRPCPSTWGLRVGADCVADDDPEAFARALAGFWAEGGRDLITPRVLARIGRNRAEIRWLFGDVSGALAALQAGVPPAIAAGLPVPPGLRGPQPAPRLPVLPDGPIGAPDQNLALGAALLDGLQDPASTVWARARD